MSKLTPAHIVYAMHAYYSQGHDLREVSRKYGLSYETIRMNFKRHGLPIRSRIHTMMIQREKQAETAAMLRDYQAGMSFRAIGRKYHYCAGAVIGRFRRRGWMQNTVGHREIDTI